MYNTPERESLMNSIVSFTWDANGNMTEHRNHPNFGMRRLCWDEENRLVRNAIEQKLEYVY